MNDVLDFSKLGSQIIFSQPSGEEEVFHQKDLVKLIPYGLSVSNDVTRPFLLLKDEAHQYTLPVAVSPIDAGVVLSQTNGQTLQSSPHKFTAMLLESMGIEIKQAVFVEIRGAHQYLRLYMTGNPQASSFKIRADEAMSLCMYLQVPMFATKGYIGRSRVMNAQVEQSAMPAFDQFFGADRGSGLLN
ncbi:hypothetical protein BDW_07165 [Bdellovibrio bacteriovorus W]|nr:hypothetical protein BDW_07165 [Bdellovibrio bacteriovorus W]